MNIEYLTAKRYQPLFKGHVYLNAAPNKTVLMKRSLSKSYFNLMHDNKTLFPEGLFSFTQGLAF
jgi:hypothetical protein